MNARHTVLVARCPKAHDALMPVKITIKGVPEGVRDELAAQAAAQRRSMEDYLRSELQRIATRPSRESLLMEVREREKALRNR